MAEKSHYDLAYVRKHVRSIVADAHAGNSCIITRNGLAYAAIVPFERFEQTRAATYSRSGLLALRGTGRGLWGTDVDQAITDLRNEWGEA